MLATIEGSIAVAHINGLATGDVGRVHFAPYLLMTGLFLFVYVYMPNTRVRLLPALIGAVVAGLLWATIGAVFTRTVVYSARTLAIYAGFAVALLFLLWIYLNWLILLLGAQLSFYLQHPEHLRAGHDEVPVTALDGQCPWRAPDGARDGPERGRNHARGAWSRAHGGR
jgi:membrane protein